MYYIKIFLILFFIYLLYKYFFNNDDNNNYDDNNRNSNNYYLTKSELEKTLINDKDDYYKSFNLLDYEVRKIKTITDYYEKIKKSCINVNNTNKQILDECIEIASNKIKKYNIIGFNGKKSETIPWNIGLITGKEYEEGFPHTRNLIIIIPESILLNKNQLLRVLIHEKIHIYQKFYKNDIEKYLIKNNFKKYKKKILFNNVRANPDIDEYIYKNNKDEMLRSIYKNNPKSILDVEIIPINNIKYEHPYEYMAYNIEKIILNL